MCCFVVPMAEAVVTTIATLVLQQTDKSKSESRNLEDEVSGAPQPFYKSLRLLARMLWLVTGVLIIDHVMNGELMWSYPFFTAATSPEGVSEMVREMSTVGVAMSAFITSVWAVMIIARKYKAQSLAKAEAHSNH
ncbi:hypothetical protein [uncultured Fibrobacter sp.]|uniref:hypothetical protein n=1 Tax=uncultured Fibrobacter sp. TaxID=261512 RepID=UPI00260BF07E|nr:hypothetical protein [uncultured Fibrobacter sp.]